MQTADENPQQPIAEALAGYRDQRETVERSVLPLASSIDGFTVTLQASVHHLALRAGGYVVLESEGISRLAEVVSLSYEQISRHEVSAPVSADPSAGNIAIRLVRGSGVVLAGDGRPFHDATVREAQPEEIGAWLLSTQPRRASLPVGELSLATAVPLALDAGGFDRHTFLCGQSGSGKTYALGLMLEQLLLQTDLRIVVLDPNSDYVRLSEVRAGVEDAAAERYRDRSRGFSLWRAEGAGGHPIRLRLSDLQPASRAALLHLDPIADREEYAALTDLLRGNVAGQPLVEDFGELMATDSPGIRELGLRASNLGVTDWNIWESGRGGSIVEALREGDFRCMVVDLGSLDTPQEQAVVAEAVLATLWEQRAERQPVLVVIDEAHNVCPQRPEDPVTARATDHVVRIAGEGRKYGLYLLVATQRPQKVHENVLSQCDNLVLMRMNSVADLGFVASAFSFVPAPLLSGATRFGLGQALVAGKIASHPAFIRFGARLAEEGGADVPSDWAAVR